MRSPLYINCTQFVVAVLLLGCLGIIQVEQFEESGGIEVDSENKRTIHQVPDGRPCTPCNIIWIKWSAIELHFANESWLFRQKEDGHQTNVKVVWWKVDYIVYHLIDERLIWTTDNHVQMTCLLILVKLWTKEGDCIKAVTKIWGNVVRDGPRFLGSTQKEERGKGK